MVLEGPADYREALLHILAIAKRNESFQGLTTASYFYRLTLGRRGGGRQSNTCNLIPVSDPEPDVWSLHILLLPLLLFHKENGINLRFLDCLSIIKIQMLCEVLLFLLLSFLSRLISHAELI